MNPWDYSSLTVHLKNDITLTFHDHVEFGMGSPLAGKMETIPRDILGERLEKRFFGGPQVMDSSMSVIAIPEWQTWALNRVFGNFAFSWERVLLIDSESMLYGHHPHKFSIAEIESIDNSAVYVWEVRQDRMRTKHTLPRSEFNLMPIGRS